MAYQVQIPKFVKLLDCDDCSSNEMCVPWMFTIPHGSRMNDSVKLIVRSGYMRRVNYIRKRSKFVGMHKLFVRFGLTGGEMLLFQYRNAGTFSLFIMGTDGGEIEYPTEGASPKEHYNTTGLTVPTYWKFVKSVGITEHIVDDIDLPFSFMLKVGNNLPSNITYILSNGNQFNGNCNKEECKISGLNRICQVLSITDFRAFTYIVFTFDMERSLQLTLFDTRNVEIEIDNAELSRGGLLACVTLPSYFLVEVQKFHMLPYCYGVDISTEYKHVTDMWRKNEQINIYQGPRKWPLVIRKRSNGKRTTILQGWIQFRNELHLNIGNRCVFKWKDESYNHFTVEVIKAVYQIDSD